MTEDDRRRWDARYAEASHRGRPHPSPFLETWLPVLPPGRALDVACGRGRNALRLARAGFAVDAVDISEVALAAGAEQAAAEGLAVDWIRADLDTAELARDAYDLVLVTRYLARAGVPDLKAALRAGGFLLYEQHVVSAGEAVGGPRTGRFRLERNELLRWFLDFHVVHYSEGLTADPDGALMALARLVAIKPPGAGAISPLPRLPEPAAPEG